MTNGPSSGSSSSSSKNQTNKIEDENDDEAATRLGITRDRAYRLIERLGLSATSRAGA
jgi:hypothetical protein